MPFAEPAQVSSSHFSEIVSCEGMSAAGESGLETKRRARPRWRRRCASWRQREEALIMRAVEDGLVIERRPVGSVVVAKVKIEAAA
jgi:hypothetical protein